MNLVNWFILLQFNHNMVDIDKFLQNGIIGKYFMREHFAEAMIVLNNLRECSLKPNMQAEGGPTTATKL